MSHYTATNNTPVNPGAKPTARAPVDARENYAEPKVVKACMNLIRVAQSHLKEVREANPQHIRDPEEEGILMPVRVRQSKFFDDSEGTPEEKGKRIKTMREMGYQRIFQILSTDLLPESRGLHSVEEYEAMAKFLEHLNFTLAKNRTEYMFTTSGTFRLRHRLQYLIVTSAVKVRNRMKMLKVAPAA